MSPDTQIASIKLMPYWALGVNLYVQHDWYKMRDYIIKISILGSP